MTTLTLKIDKRTKAGKAFMAMCESFFKKVEGIEIIETVSKKVAKEGSPYNSEFAEMVLNAKQQIQEGKTTVIDTNDIWGSLGLK